MKVQVTNNQNKLEMNAKIFITEVECPRTDINYVPVGVISYERVSNKTQTIDENSTEVQYPSAKCVYDAIQNIPGGEQVQSDWTQTDDTQVDFIKHKPSLSAVATSGDYDDLSNKPVIPVVPTNVSAFTNDADYLTADRGFENFWHQANWNESDIDKLSYILNKPNLATVATSGSYTDLTNKPTIPVQAQSISSGDTGYTTGDMVYNYIQSLNGTQIPY